MNTTGLVDQEGGCHLIGCTNYFSYYDLSEFATTKGYCSKRRSFESFYPTQLTSSKYQLVYLVYCVRSLSKKDVFSPRMNMSSRAKRRVNIRASAPSKHSMQLERVT